MTDFAYEAHEVEFGAPEYNVVTSEMEWMRIKTRLKSTLPRRTFTLTFKLQSATEKNALLSHYNGQYGAYQSFNWTSIPDDLSSESSIEVRYKSFDYERQGYNIFEVKIEFIEVL